MILGGCRRGGVAPRGEMVGEIEGYLWMPRRSANVRGEEEATAAVGGAMKRKWCVLCRSTFLLGYHKYARLGEISVRGIVF